MQEPQSHGLISYYMVHITYVNVTWIIGMSTFIMMSIAILFHSGWRVTINEIGGSMDIVVEKDTIKNHNVCVFVWGTTVNEEHKNETIETMELYRKLENVWFFMDDFSYLNKSILNEDEKLCKNMNVKCIFLSYPNNSYSHIAKMVESFNEIQKLKLYNNCDFMIKIDTDAYVDVNGYSKWLKLISFNPLESLYFGETMHCGYIWFVQGTYSFSKGIFINHKLNFSNLEEKCQTDDVTLGTYLTKIHKIKLTRTSEHILGYKQPKREHELF